MYKDARYKYAITYLNNALKKSRFFGVFRNDEEALYYFYKEAQPIQRSILSIDKKLFIESENNVN